MLFTQWAQFYNIQMFPRHPEIKNNTVDIMFLRVLADTSVFCFLLLHLFCFLLTFWQDANDNRIGQWLNETSNSKILQLSYSLNSECAEGTYKIKIETDGETISHWFKVEKYGKFVLLFITFCLECSALRKVNKMSFSFPVLPKFEIKLTSASEINIHQEEFEAELCAK